MRIPERYWGVELGELLRGLDSSPSGLTGEQAVERAGVFGKNLLRKKKEVSRLSMLMGQFKTPITLILLFAVFISSIVGSFIDASIIFVIIVISGLLGFIQEYSASNAVERLVGAVKTRASVLRGGVKSEILTEDIVPGDVLYLSAGDMVPADSVLLEAKDFFVREAILTGETFPVEKGPGVSHADAPLTQRKNCVFMGTNVISGTAAAVAVSTAESTEVGRIAGRLVLRPPETDFERGIRRFGYFLMEVTLVLVLVVFAVNVYFRAPVIDSLMFSLALAVGLTPQLLPAIITVNLARGSQKMSEKDVIVKRLASIENFGTMDILCTDKTGTLTEGTISLSGHPDIMGKDDARTLFYACLNAHYQTGLKNPIDTAIVKEGLGTQGYEKADEIPYDFERKRLSVVVRRGGERILISKGALIPLLTVCDKAEIEGAEAPIEGYLEEIDGLYNAWSEQGLRVLGVAYRRVGEAAVYGKADEKGMTLLGFLLFSDPPKQDASRLVREIEDLGVEVKIITGDNRFVSAHTARGVGFPEMGIVTGPDLDNMGEEAILHAVEAANIFAEVDPIQKEKIILSLKKRGHVVGFMGDGINDAAALHAADVGISVDTAVDVAREAADIILLEKGLETLRDGVIEGRKTFANTIKYVFMATSANFGNMFSVAGASLFLPFLPMLPKQILLTNLLTDFPELTISADRVDEELVERPRRWDVRFIKRFMVYFGLLSSIFDYVTFAVLYHMLKAGPTLFRTGWFIESVLSASFAVMVLRTRKPFYRSRPGKYLLITTVIIAAVAVAIPFTPLSGLMGFADAPLAFMYALGAILIAYIGLIEAAKAFFYRKLANGVKT